MNNFFMDTNGDVLGFRSRQWLGQPMDTSIPLITENLISFELMRHILNDEYYIL